MSRYNKLIKEILDGIFEGYKLDETGKLKVVSESAAKTADSALHRLVLEKSRDLWDQLEASEDSLSDVAEEISFEELNADPSSVDMTLHAGANTDTPELAPQEEPTLESLLGSEEFSLDGIFEVLDAHEPPMADGGPKDEPTMMDAVGDEEEDVVDGDEDFENLDGGFDDAGMGSSDMEGGEEGDEMGMDPEGGEMDMEPEGGEMGMDPEGGEAFDFDLELGGEEGDLEGDLEGGEMGMDPEGGLEGEFGDENGGLEGELGDELEGLEGLEGEEEEPAEEGYGSKPYNMEM